MSKLIFIIIYIGTFESTHHIIPISIPVFDEATDFSILPLQTNKERRYYFKHNNFIHSGIVKSKIGYFQNVPRRARPNRYKTIRNVWGS